MTQADKALSSIVLFGETHAVWPVAVLLRANLPGHIRLTIVEDEDNPTAPAALSLPCDSRFHQSLDIAVQDLVRDCNGTLALGADCQGWQGDGSQFFNAPSGTLPSLGGVALHHVMLRAALLRNEPEKLAYLMRPFRFCARAAEAGKFAFQSDDPQSPLTMLGPIIQCDRADYGAYFKQRFSKEGADICQGRPVRLTHHEEGRAIAAVELDDGTSIAADLFVDVSGDLSALMPEPDRPSFISLSDFMPFDRQVSGAGAGERLAEQGHCVARALPGAVLVQTVLGEGCCSELLYSSEMMEESAAQELVGDGASARPFHPGYVETPWRGNVARLGGASARFGPYLSSDVRLLHEQALHFVACIPARCTMDVEAAEFNRRHTSGVQQVRDALLLPFVLNRRTDAPWADIAEVTPPETLRLRLEQFRSRGRFVTFDDELFDEQSWIDMMIGFGLVPERYDPAVQAFDMKRVAPALKSIVMAFTQAIEAMPNHADFMADYPQATG